MKPHPPAGEHGFTLIELMISMVIALVVFVAVANAYLGVSAAARFAATQGHMNEDGQMALALFVEQLKQAGANPAQPNRSGTTHNQLPNTFMPVRGCDVQFSNIPAAATADLLTCAHSSTSSGPSSLSIGFEADAYNTLPNAARTPTDCLGQALDPLFVNPTDDQGTAFITKTFVAENRFYIGGATTSSINLNCRGAGGTAGQPMIENIEHLEVLFGTATPTDARAVAGYLTAYAVDNSTVLGPTPANQVQRWGYVRTARVCVLVRSAEEVAPSAESARYYNCAGTLVTDPPDRRLRAAYTRTVVVGNQ